MPTFNKVTKNIILIYKKLLDRPSNYANLKMFKQSVIAALQSSKSQYIILLFQILLPFYSVSLNYGRPA